MLLELLLQLLHNNAIAINSKEIDDIVDNAEDVLQGKNEGMAIFSSLLLQSNVYYCTEAFHCCKSRSCYPELRYVANKCSN